MRSETLGLIEQIRKSLTLLGQRMDIETAPHRLEEFDAMTEDPELWNDPARAQALMRDRRMLSDALETYRSIAQELEDQIGLIELGEAEGDADVVAEAEEELRKLAKSAGEKELEALLNGEADSNDTFLEINAGAGGTESCGLGVDAGAHVCALGREERLHGRIDVRKRGRGSGHPLCRL